MTRACFMLRLGVLLLGATVVSAAQVFDVTATFAETDAFGLAEFTARVDACQGNFAIKSNELKADCVSRLISTSASCSEQPDGAFFCIIDDVTIDTNDIAFDCGIDGCPRTNSTLKDLMDAEMACATSFAKQAKFSEQCFDSAYCLMSTALADSTDPVSFGDFCPSLTGEYCCGDGTTRSSGLFPTNSSYAEDERDYSRKVDHVANMDITITYDVKAPAQLQLKVEVPYVTADSSLTFTENDVLQTRKMCPTTYLIDFLPPLETMPVGATRSPWMPLNHFPSDDFLGKPRSTCSSYDMNYDASDGVAFSNAFGYPNGTSDDLAYGSVLGVTPNVWDVSQGTVGIPHATVGETPVTFWHKGVPVGGVPGQQRITYTVGDLSGNGHFDLVKAWSKCKDLKTNAQLVKKNPSVDDTLINGVAYPVETYEWTLSVCSVGYFGPNCETQKTPAQMYAKTCRQIPASFSVTPQQISHVVVAPITQQLVSKTFLQTVDAFASNCESMHERIAVTLNLVIFGTDYDIASSNVHDLLSPANVFSSTSSTEDFSVEEPESDANNFLEFESEVSARGADVVEGVYVLNKRNVISGSVSVYYRKVVIVSKCYKTEWNPSENTRAAPGVFAEAIVGSEGNVLFDLEIILKKSKVNVAGDLDAVNTTDIINTINLRVLATKETFILPTENKLKQKDATASQHLYGSYAAAQSDNVLGLPGALPSNAILSGGDQVCSKHQLSEFDAQVVNLIPNAVGSCMLKQTLPAWTDGLIGTTIEYLTTGMTVPAKYTYGCFPDWINVEGVALNEDNVYEFSGRVPTFASAHDSIFWFVQKQELEETQLLANEKMSDRFGTALFWYNTTFNGAADGQYMVTRSDEFQADTNARFDVNPAGCITKAGALKSSCNLMCFDLVDGLLTDPNGNADRSVLVHHVSVAMLATENDTVVASKFGGAPNTRRMLLQSVVPLAGPQSNSVSSGTTQLSVKPGPLQQRNMDGDVDAASDVIERDIDGPGKGVAAILNAVFISLIFIITALAGVCCIKKRYAGKSYYSDNKEAPSPTSAHFQSSATLRKPLMHTRSGY